MFYRLEVVGQACKEILRIRSTLNYKIIRQETIKADGADRSEKRNMRKFYESKDEFIYEKKHE